MTMASTRGWWFVFVTSIAVMFPAPWLAGQVSQPPAGQDNRQPAPPTMLDDLDKLPGMGDFLRRDGGGAEELSLAGSLQVNRGQRTGVIQVRATLAPSWHVYAVDQDGGPGPTKITLPATDQIRQTGDFRPDKPPEVRKVEFFDTPLREHYGEVTWSAPVELGLGVDPEKLKLEAQFDGQICNDDVGCKPIFGKKIEIVFGGFIGAAESPAAEAKPAAPDVPASTGEFRAPRSRVSLQGYVEPSGVAPGGKLRLAITASLDSGWHIYAYAPRDPQLVAKPTLIVLTEPATWTLGSVAASQAPIVKQADGEQPAVSYHEGSVTWTAELTVPADAAAGEHSLAGIVGYQTCTETGCDRPLAARFTAQVTVGGPAVDKRRPLAFTADRYAEAATLASASSAATVPAPTAAPTVAPTAAPQTEGPSTAASPEPSPAPAAAEVSRTSPATASVQTPLPLVLLYAFLGGLILNVMPCVLPVIGLKIMAFVQQAGESRAKVFALNVWYSLGLISVFLVLATLLVVWNVGWGEQFSSEALTITLAAVVFAMGLSFLGVWQMPIPGFAMGDTAAEFADKEGPAGAFAKGIITTILATPCSGPGVAIALGYCQGKPPSVVYTIFAMVGLGMASPYLMIGAFPKCLKLLPRPGAWMETFERLMGLVLLGTVIYLLSFTDWANVLPAVALLLGVGAACWWIGQIPITSEFPVRLRGWLAGTAVVALSALLAFTGKTTIRGSEVFGLRGIMEHRLEKYVQQQAALHSGGDEILNSPEITQHTTTIRWLPYSERRLDRLTSDKRTVLVDFTADWCLTCKTLEATVLNTQEVRDVLRANGVVTLQADWTDGDAEISRKLESLGSKQVPVVAIFPAGRAQEPIVLMGFYTKASLLQKLQDAGPSS